MTITIYCAPHNAEAFTLTLHQLFQNSDIVFLERASTSGEEIDQAVEERLRLVAMGEITPDGIMRFLNPNQQSGPEIEYTLGLMKLIYRSRKDVHLEYSPLSGLETQELLSFSSQKMPKDSLEAFLQWYEARERTNATKWKMRDLNIARQLSDLSINNYNSMILAIYGDLHYRALQRFLADNGIDNIRPIRLFAETHATLLVSKLELEEEITRRELMLAFLDGVVLAKRSDSEETIKAANVKLSKMPDQHLEAKIQTWLARFRSC